MKTLYSKYPKIKFVYSLPYDRLLTEYENKRFNNKKIKEIGEYIKQLQLRWNKINNSVCQTLGKIVKNKWREKEIKCYVVKNLKYSGISNPFTIKVDPNFHCVFDVLIHELAHICVSGNSKKYKRIEQKLKRQFQRENQRTILHIYINFIELQTLKKVFNQKVASEILQKVQKFKGLKRSWEIVLSKENILQKLLK